MDIAKIGVCQGEVVDFEQEVHPSMKMQCEILVKKSQGPYKVFRNLSKKTPLQFLDEAFAPLQEFKDKIAYVIDSSTTRGFAEPSQSSLYAQHLGLFSSNCFDISEACNGFIRALNIAYMLFQNTQDMKEKYILLINNEQPIPDRALVPQDPFNYDQCISYYVGLTFSNVCTCTLLKASDNHSWVFYNKAETIYATHISIGLPFIADGYLPQNEVYKVTTNNQYGQFCLPKYHQQSRLTDQLVKFTNTRREFMKTTNIICHTFSKSAWVNVSENFEKKNYYLYFDIAGNLGSCSLPYILNDKFKNSIPDLERFNYFATAAGGSLICLEFIHNAKQSERKEPLCLIEIDHKEAEDYAKSQLKATKKINHNQPSPNL